MLATTKYTPFTTLSIATGYFCNFKSGYSFRFNGQEQDNEVSGTGNIMTAEFWMYDGRLGRRWNCDPVVKEHESPFVTFSNNPINYIDFAGNDTSEVFTSGGSAKSHFDLASKNAKQGDKLTVHAGLSLTASGNAVYTENITRIYHAGNAYAESGWYSENDYIYANLDYSGGQILPPAKWFEIGDRYVGGDPNLKNSGYVVNQNGYLTGDYNFGYKEFEVPLYFPSPGKGSNVWKVGLYNELKGMEAGLDAHHAGQAAIMEKLVPGYNRYTAPAILVPNAGHTRGMNVLSRSLHGITNPRQLLARDIMELRRVYGKAIPNSSLQELINLNKKLYPNAFRKF
jgi:RHS repeat-associated protein